MASELAGREEPFVLAVVVRRQPASSAQAGDMALITAAGEFHGWLGGSCTQPTVVREARRALADGRPRLLALSPDPEAERRPGVAVFPMTCHSGGSVEIYLDPILPATRLLIFGASPIARALATLGHAMGYSVSAMMDGTADEAAPAAAAHAATTAGGATGAGGGAAAGDPAGRGARCYAVVATMGDRDEEAIREALALRPAYLGVVASARRFAQVRESLLAQGVAAAALDSIRSPAGVAIGAQEPAEIAVSVLAEIVALRHAAEEAQRTATTSASSAAPEASETAETAETAEINEAAAGQAIDPICGMTVETAGARHTAEAGGRTWYFCGESCRGRFLAAPERFAAAAAPREPGAVAPRVPAAPQAPPAPGQPRRSAGGV
ncbi:MAG TPA: XdhC family protein [Thermoanaerobaculia bacterium]|nr:XdhC family protein [Thermoanaerobaculia bacterium]